MLNTSFTIHRLNPSPTLSLSLSPFPLPIIKNPIKNSPNQAQFQSMASTIQLSDSEFLTKRPYYPPSWASKLNPIPSHGVPGHWKGRLRDDERYGTVPKSGKEERSYLYTREGFLVSLTKTKKWLHWLGNDVEWTLTSQSLEKMAPDKSFKNS